MKFQYNTKIGLIVLILLGICNQSTANLMVTNVDIEPSVVWIHKNPEVRISALCSINSTSIMNADVRANIYDPDSMLVMSPILTYDQNSGKYTGKFQSSFSKTGIYKVNVSCVYGKSKASSVRELIAHKLELQILKEDKLIRGYMGDELKLLVSFKKDGQLISPSQNTFDVYIGKFRGRNAFREELDLTTIPIIREGYQEIDLEIPLRSDDISEGIYDIEVTARVDDENITFEGTEFIKINAPLKIDISEDSIKCFAGNTCEKELTLNVRFSVGTIDDLSLENIEAMIIDEDARGKKTYIDSMDCDKDSGTCTIILDIPPTLDPGEYDVFITMAYPSISSYEYITKDSIPLEIVLQLSGSIVDASGNAIDTTITLENKDTGQTVSRHTDTSGKYTMDILPGEYDIELKFAKGVIAKFEDVFISESDVTTLSDNLIRYDQDHLNSGAPGGVRIVEIVVLEFALPFSDARIYIPYDSTDVQGDENELRVYKCDKWNFKRSSCSGDWELVECEVHSIRDVVEFDFNSSAAFVIGEIRSLKFSNLELKKDKVYMGEVVSTTGKVIDHDGNPVEGAIVKASFPRFNISRETTTGAGGLFTAQVPAPYAEGVVDLMLEAGSGPFLPCITTTSISVIRKKELAIVGIPDIVEVNLNEARDIKFKLFNSGQVNLTDPINIHITGISSDWYEISPFRINGLDANGQKEINLRVKLTTELCGGKCPAYTLVNIEAKSEQVSKAMSFTLRVLQPELPENRTKTPEKEPTSFTFPNIIGWVPAVGMPALNSNYLFLIAIIIILVLIATKKKKGRGRGQLGMRKPVVKSLHTIKLGI